MKTKHFTICHSIILSDLYILFLFSNLAFIQHTFIQHTFIQHTCTLKNFIYCLAFGKEAIGLQILHCFNQRLQEMHQTIHDLISERAIVRLSRAIYYSGQRYGVSETSLGQQLNSKLPYQQLSRMIGITYEECVRLVKKELKDILIYQRGGIITIQDEAALVAVISVALD